ncbi:pentapeptide repeat-containing protein [Nonomuraea maritima]|uniref:pentapeptide repeat-containing protein n=1 Tax=Nonomuraea maritima TaxID=683260 RepID=UPI003712D7AC
MWWWVFPAALLIGAATWATSAWLLQDLGQLPIDKQISTRIEVARTALAAAAGVGAAVTLMLAVRRQRHQELATAHTTHDATERRVTELYTKAVEQLGNDQAPVRLGGLYALERLAQDTPALRQTIVDVVCAYLRMPYTPLREDRYEKVRVAQRNARTGISRSAANSSRDPEEELQVRLTAQRILTDHLRFQAPRRRWRQRHADHSARHWPDIHLDLVGATLINLDLSNCRFAEAKFAKATFTGHTLFHETTFTDTAWFNTASFADDVWFDGAVFTEAALFHSATFTRDVFFRNAAFTGDVRFNGASFECHAVFDEAVFSEGTDIRFDEVTGLEAAELDGVRLMPAAENTERVWPPSWREESGTDGWHTLRLAEAAEDASASGAAT